MGQQTPFNSPREETEDDMEPNVVLGWAQIAGLVDIRRDGSWDLTRFGRLRVLELAVRDGKVAAADTQTPQAKSF